MAIIINSTLTDVQKSDVLTPKNPNLKLSTI